jgi:hypothetical protein
LAIGTIEQIVEIAFFNSVLSCSLMEIRNLEKSREHGLTQVVLLHQREKCPKSGTEPEDYWEDIVARHGDDYLKLTVHGALRFLPSSHTFDICEQKISAQEYAEFAKGKTPIDP